MSFVLAIQTGGGGGEGSCASGNPGERGGGVKKRPHPSGGVDFSGITQFK